MTAMIEEYSKHSFDSEKQENCGFCKDIASEQHILKRYEHFCVLSNVYPYEDNHVLLLPMRHIKSELDFDACEISELSNIHTSLLRTFYAHFGMCFYFTRENTPNQTMWHWHRHYVPSDQVLKYGVRRVEYKGVTLNLR
jgi:diadenosine tetraphosphate (Ap4A) HIT family hydrolase